MSGVKFSMRIGKSSSKWKCFKLEMTFGTSTFCARRKKKPSRVEKKKTRWWNRVKILCEGRSPTVLLADIVNAGRKFMVYAVVMPKKLRLPRRKVKWWYVSGIQASVNYLSRTIDICLWNSYLFSLLTCFWQFNLYI